MSNDTKTSTVLMALAGTFVLLALVLATRSTVLPPPKPFPLVDPALLVPTTMRTSYLQLIHAKADLSDFDCYACHEKGKPPTLRFDTNHNIVVPKEHSDIVMGHGRHNRNNNCFNCHDEQNLQVLQTRDGRELKLEESPPLCGSCHGPTYRDWEAGAHGRTGGYWDRTRGELTRRLCVDCHNPHSPKILPRNPFPPPHLLHPVPSSPELTGAHNRGGRTLLSAAATTKSEPRCSLELAADRNVRAPLLSVTNRHGQNCPRSTEAFPASTYHA
ncbi:MAG TPA: hypothetical protein VG167_10990 [Verrucomicrobiae bacterium]|nr:hypothetical protein [Verrucomicrobiae bacterium]